LNVVAYRMPLGMSVIWKPSHCPQCNHAIRPYDNVPVFGWLWLRGKCRDCGEPISPRYAIVELVMGLAFFVLAYAEIFSGGANLPGGPITEFTGAVHNFLVPHWPLIGVYAYHGVLLSLLMCVVLIDMDKQQVPTKFVAFGLLVGFLAPLIWPHFHRPSPPVRVFWETVASIKLLCLFVGCLIGTFFWGRDFWGDQTQWNNALFGYRFQCDFHEKNLGFMLILAWSFLGWQALLFLCVVVFVVRGLFRLTRKLFKDIPQFSVHTSLLTTTLLLVVFWRQLTEISPW